MIHYILQIVVFQILFLVVYDVFLKKELFFKWNRIYLLLTPVLSFILPLIKLDFIRRSIPEEYIIQLPEIILGATSSKVTPIETLEEITLFGTSAISATQIWQLIWILGALISLGIFIFKLYKITRLKKSGIKNNYQGTSIISLPKTDIAFSFLNTIFLGEELSKTQKETILLHEKIHIQQRHSVDLLYFETIKIFCWFNPLIYIFQSKMMLLQEFIADENTASQKGKKAYYQGLLSQVFKTESTSFINTFFNQSIIKKRIIMLQKSIPNSRDKKIAQLKYLLLLPVIGIMLTYTSCVQEPETVQISSVSDLIANLKVALENEKLSDSEVKELMTIISNSGNNIEITHEVAANENGTAIPFAVIDKVPIYPGCSGDNESLKNCMSQKIGEFVGNEFNTKLSKDSNLSGRQRIVVQFKIDKTGFVVGIRAKAAHKVLEEEAIRVVSKLPQMLPGEHKGKVVSVQYALPIVFELKE